jgi:sigma-E factor negative regulatory protein RseB
VSRRRARWIGLALAGVCLPALSASEPSEWLAQMSEAARDANYRGVIVYQARDRLETMRVVHRFQDGVELERVQTLTGVPREIIKQDNKVICLLPRDRKVTVERPTPKGLFPGLTPERVAQIAQTYQFQDLGTARVAGRICRGIAITPRDEFRYGYEVWADAAKAVPLKVNLVSRDGAVLEQMMFTEVEFPATIPDSALQSELDPTQYVNVTRMAAAPVPQQPGAIPRFERLPPGFRVTMRDVRPSADGKGTVEHLLLSDGLSAVSVFSTRREIPARVFQGVSQMGAVHAYGRMMGTLHITVVGEAPPETVRLIGESLKMQPESSAPSMILMTPTAASAGTPQH